MKLDLSLKTPSATIRHEGIELDEPDLEPAAEAVAANVRAAVAAQRDGRWDRTGTLRAGIVADGTSVVVPPGRLERDPALAEKFRTDVMPANPLDDEAVQEAIAAALHEAVGGG